MRYLFVYSFVWLEEVSGFLFVWICFIGAFLSLREGGHARVDFLTIHVSRKSQAILDIVANILTVIILAIFIVAGTKATILAHSRLSSSLELPWSLVYAAFPLGMTLLVGQLVVMILKDLKTLGQNN